MQLGAQPPDPGATHLPLFRRAFPQRRRRVVRFDVGPRTVVTVLVVFAGIWLLIRLLPVVVVLLTSLILVGALNPLVRRLQERRVGRIAAIAVVFGTLVAITGGLLVLMVPPLIAQLRSVAEHAPQIREHVAGFLDESPLTAVLAQQLRDLNFSDLVNSSRDSLLNATKRTFEILAYGLGSIFLALYIFIDADRLRGGLFSVVPRQHHVRLSRILLNLEKIVGGYIRGQVITCVLITAFMIVLLMVCQVPNALALAVFGGIADVLPYVGPLLTIVPAVLAAYGVSPAVAVIVFVALVLYEEFESRVLIPLVYGRALRVPSSVVFLSLLIGATLAGIIGALLALPAAAAVLMLIEELRVDLPGETQKPGDVVARMKDRIEEQQYARRAEAAPVAEASAIAVEIAKERNEADRAEKKANAEAESPNPEV